MGGRRACAAHMEAVRNAVWVAAPRGFRVGACVSHMAEVRARGRAGGRERGRGSEDGGRRVVKRRQEK